jgi:serine protease Do
MKNEQLLEMIERYLDGEMTLEERAEFDALRTKDAAVEAKLEEHKNFTGLLRQYNDRHNMELRLNAIHDEIDVHTLAHDLMSHPSIVVRLWRQHHSKISVAASIAIFATLLTLFFTGYLTNKDPRFVPLADKVRQIEIATRPLITANHPAKRGPIINANYKGTGFALTGNGYIVTNSHVIADADSVYVQNFDGESFKSKVIYSDPASDVAVLQIIDTAFKNLGTVPYSFKKSESRLGENVFTLGYPGNSIKFGPGAVTANTGFRGDTAEYEVYIPVNPGNSGGPLIDDKGNIVGVINGKQTQTSGAAFAIKSNVLLKAIKDIPTDSLSKTLNLNTKNTLAGLSRPDQIEKLHNFVFIVKVYKQ